MRHLTSLLAVITLVSPAHLSAQRGNITAGRQIRLMVPHISSELITGTVVMADANRVLFRLESPSRFWGDTLDVDISTIESIELNVGPKSRGPRTFGYGVLGGLVGALGGALIWPLISSSSCRPNAVAEEAGSGCIDDLVFDGSKRREGALIFGAAGALIGGIAGYLSAAPQWTVVNGDRIDITVAPHRHRVGLQSVIRF